MVTAFATNPFKPATKAQAKLRMAIIGPSGSGKTWTALSIACELGKVALIDTERGSASKYAGDFTFDVLELTSYSPQNYIDAIKAAAQFGYDAVVIDSLSHAWNAPGGVLDMVDKAAKRSQSNNSFAAWRDVTPLHNQLIDALVGTPIHLIATMRSKTEYVLEQNERGKTMPRKVGLAPVQRDGMEYEFDIFAEMDMENTLIVSKTRCSALNGAVIPKPGKNVAEVIGAWLSDGEPVELKIVEPVKPAATEAGQDADTPPVLTLADVDAALNPIQHRYEPNAAGNTRVIIKLANEKRQALDEIAARGFRITNNGGANWFDIELKYENAKQPDAGE